MYLGDYDEARRRARLSIRTFGRLGETTERAKTRINYGNIFHRLDQHRQARNQYLLARRDLEGTDKNRLVLGLCDYNLGNSQVQLLEFVAARRSYSEASGRFAELGYRLYVNECDYGLAWLDMLEGSYHEALQGLRKCEAEYREVGHKKGVLLCTLDRAEASMGLNLFVEALESARSAEVLSRSLSLAYESAKASFFRARAANALGNKSEAQKAADRAIRGFRREGNRGFEAAVRLFKSQMGDDEPLSSKHLHKIRSIFKQAQLPLWEAICDLELLSRNGDTSEITRRLARNQATRAVPHLYARWQTALGDRSMLHGRRRMAAKYWRRAAEALESVRSKLPPVELQSSFMKGRGDPYHRLVVNLVADNPTSAAVWVDRRKTVGVWGAAGDAFETESLRKEAEASLSKLAGRVSALLDGKVRTGDTREAVRVPEPALRRLQRDARDRLAAVDGRSAARLSRGDGLEQDLRDLSHKITVLQFWVDGDDIIGFVHRNGQSRVVRWPDGTVRARRFFGIWQISANRSLATGRRPNHSDLGEEEGLFSAIGEWLWKPLEIPAYETDILVIPDGVLYNFPWQAIRVEGQCLAERHRLLMAPSVQHHLHASSLETKSNRVALFVGDEAAPQSVRAEKLALKAVAEDVTVFDACARDDWPSEGEWRIWHYTGHARYRSDNPFYSSLELRDGPLFGADFRLKRCTVGLVTLAACRTAYHSTLGGEETTGLVRCLLEMGARNVIGSLWPVTDRSSAYWMRMLYSEVLHECPIPEAARRATLKTKEKYVSTYEWAPFSVYGAG
jgi:tetratricopeptide (TPR) repeat protein